jgi:hypothetical protein
MAMKITVFFFLLFVSSVFGQGTQNFDIDAHCTGKDFQMLEHPNDCSSYVLCLPATPSVFTCPTGYVYHPTLLTCVISHQCNAQSLEQVICRNSPGRRFVNPINCLEYIDCSQPLPAMRTCGPNQIFSMTYGRCLRGNTNTCSLLEVPTTICQGQAVDARLAHPYLCEDYIVCAAGGAQVRQCGAGNIFNVATGQCVTGNPALCT